MSTGSPSDSAFKRSNDDLKFTSTRFTADSTSNSRDESRFSSRFTAPDPNARDEVRIQNRFTTSNNSEDNFGKYNTSMEEQRQILEQFKPKRSSSFSTATSADTSDLLQPVRSRKANSKQMSLVDKYSNFMGPTEDKTDTAKLAEEFCVSVDEQEKILKQIAERKTSTVVAPILSSSPTTTSSPRRSKSRSRKGSFRVTFDDKPTILDDDDLPMLEEVPKPVAKVEPLISIIDEYKPELPPKKKNSSASSIVDRYLTPNSSTAKVDLDNDLISFDEKYFESLKPKRNNSSTKVVQEPTTKWSGPFGMDDVKLPFSSATIDDNLDSGFLSQSSSTHSILPSASGGAVSKQNAVKKTSFSSETSGRLSRTGSSTRLNSDYDSYSMARSSSNSYLSSSRLSRSGSSSRISSDYKITSYKTRSQSTDRRPSNVYNSSENVPSRWSSRDVIDDHSRPKRRNREISPRSAVPSLPNANKKLTFATNLDDPPRPRRNHVPRPGVDNREALRQMLCDLRKDPMDDEIEANDGAFFPCEFCGDPYPVEYLMRHQVSFYPNAAVQKLQSKSFYLIFSVGL